MDHNCLDAQPLISIIVPVFNVEAFVERCMISLISQSYENIEIIMVDDGSTDRSGKICDKYQQKDPRVKVIHKSNGGLSDARNAGIEQASGKYLSFVDADDWVAKDYIAEMYQIMNQTGGDIVCCRFRRTLKDEMIRNKMHGICKVYFREEAIKRLLYQNISTSANGKLYKTDLWSDIKFPVGKLYEDVETIYFIFNQCEKVACTYKILYFYYLRDDSIVNRKFSVKKLDYVENCKRLLESVKLDYPQFESAAVSRLMWAELHVLVHMDASAEYSGEYQMLIDDVKKLRGTVIRDRRNRLKTRAVAILSCLGVGVLKAVFRATRRRFG